MACHPEQPFTEAQEKCIREIVDAAVGLALRQADLNSVSRLSVSETLQRLSK